MHLECSNALSSPGRARGAPAGEAAPSAVRWAPDPIPEMPHEMPPPLAPDEEPAELVRGRRKEGSSPADLTFFVKRRRPLGTLPAQCP